MPTVYYSWPLPYQEEGVNERFGPNSFYKFDLVGLCLITFSKNNMKIEAEIQKVLEEYEKEFYNGVRKNCLNPKYPGPEYLKKRVIKDIDKELGFLSQALHRVVEVERERIEDFATKYTAWVAPYLKAISYGADPEAAKNISKWHQARWEEFIKSLSHSEGKKCECHCHLGGNYKDCKGHEVLSCRHCPGKEAKNDH